MEDGRAEAQYATAKTSVWWDIEHCAPPSKGSNSNSEYDPNGIAQNISSAMMNMGYKGPVTISAYGDTAKVPMAIQHALSSTGISLINVPAGVKDASDKKILVDMLFWAVDNPAPANYLLISGDRDFSNALHQLRMRRYNILLAQPNYVSPALLSAAKSVWLWTTLVAGGPPLTLPDGAQPPPPPSLPPPPFSHTQNTHHNNANNISKTESLSQKVTSVRIDNLLSGNNKLSGPASARSGGESKYKAIYIRKIPSQSSIITQPSASRIEVPKNNKNNGKEDRPQKQLPVVNAPKLFKTAPREFFTNNAKTLAQNISLSGKLGKTKNNFSTAANQNLGTLNSCTPNYQLSNVPPLPLSHNAMSFPFVPVTNKFDKPGIHDSNKISESPANSCQVSSSSSANGSEKVHASQFSSSSSGSSIVSGNSIWRIRKKTTQSLEGIQGNTDVILLALSTLEADKMMPTEVNLTDCIRYGELKHRNIQVKKALDCATEQDLVTQQKLGDVQVYVGKNQQLWEFLNADDGNINQYSSSIWDRIHEFLTSEAGRSAIMASQCRYEAALLLKSACLNCLPLGKVLQMLNMLITTKKWIIPHQSGWEPITLALPLNN